MEWVGAEGLLGSGLNSRPRETTVGVDPVVHLVVRSAVALGGPGVGGWAGQFQALPPVMVLAMGRRVSWMVARSVSVVMRARDFAN